MALVQPLTRAIAEFPGFETHASLQPGAGAVKRTLDFMVALAGLVVLLPLWCMIALAIKLDSPGPVLYRQKRAGLHGQDFSIFKFRSMYVDAEARQAGLAERNEQKGPIFKLKDDPRITPFGKFLRRTSLDEFPQLLNVLRGEMSLVGPRPLPTYEVAQFEPWQWEKLAVKPGITGLWQVSGRSDLEGFDQMIELDLTYIHDWTLDLDFKILARTLPAVVTGRGAH